jgi:excisionase family DNA binding protein
VRLAQAAFHSRSARHTVGMFPTPQPDIVLLDELARRLRLPKSFLQRETRAGRIPSLRAGNRRVFNPDAVRQALAEQAAHGGEGVSDD